MARPSVPKELQKLETISIRIEAEENLRLAVAVYLEGTNKSELLGREIKRFNQEVQAKDPEKFAVTYKQFKKYRAQQKAIREGRITTN